ncbi:glycosyltransferase family 4 protein [Chthonobacter albigriseus]|uniref:glycosyltransferase family 4 protein n=1 Tax=Chthonobacter albigriseus TaxID=1683161 RepID=UPI0015EE3B96|nr:glycosyltransferase family 4 protein [Chthonobacter albigriseus]
MKITLAGPFDTAAFSALSGLDLEGYPAGAAGGVVVPLLAHQLLERGHTVSVVSLDATIDTVSRVARDRFALTYVPLRGAPRYRARVRAMDLFSKEIRALEAEIRAVSSDLVHAHWTYEYAEAAVRSGIPHVVTMHDVGWDNLWLYRDAYRLMRLIMMLRVMPRIQRLTVVSPMMKRLPRHYGYFGPVDVVSNGVSVPTAEPQADRDLSKRFNLVTVGDATRRKNVRASVLAFREVKCRLPHAELHLFGPGLETSFAHGEPGVVGHGPAAHETLMSFLSDHADVLVHPSLQETFGVIIAEAKARGVPAIGGVNSGAVSHVLGEAGLAVDVRNPDAIANAVLHLQSDLTAYQRLREASRRDIEQRFDVERTSSVYMDVYTTIRPQTDTAGP